MKCSINMCNWQGKGVPWIFILKWLAVTFADIRSLVLVIPGNGQPIASRSWNVSLHFLRAWVVLWCYGLWHLMVFNGNYGYCSDVLDVVHFRSIYFRSTLLQLNFSSESSQWFTSTSPLKITTFHLTWNELLFKHKNWLKRECRKYSVNKELL